MNDNKKIITEFIGAWSRLDPAELAGYFTDDGIYYNIPITPVAGKKEIEEFIKSFTVTWKETNWELLHIAAMDDLVFTERMDRTKTTSGKDLELPCMGVFEMENGKIKVWRDYFDLGTYLKAFE